MYRPHRIHNVELYRLRAAMIVGGHKREEIARILSIKGRQIKEGSGVLGTLRDTSASRIPKGIIQGYLRLYVEKARQNPLLYRAVLAHLRKYGR